MNANDFSKLDFLIGKTIAVYLMTNTTSRLNFTLVNIIDEVGLIVRPVADQAVGTLIPFHTLYKVEWEWQGAAAKSVA